MNKNYLKAIYNTIKNSEYNGVKGVIHLKSFIPGPIVGITICTHGNEPCGLAVVKKLQSKEFSLESGEIFIVLNNLEATGKYFMSNSEEEESSCRFVDLNMNRLPDNLTNNSEHYEVRRAFELQKIWNKFDYAIDLHSTPQKSDPFIVEGYKSIKEFSKYLPAKIILKDMLKIQIGKPAIAFYGNSSSLTFGLEAGSHNDNSALDVSIDSALSLLSYLKMTKYNLQETSHSVFEITNSIIVPNSKYSLIKDFHMFTKISKDETIATDGNDFIKSPCDGFIILAPKGTNIRNYKEEALFICNEI